MTGALWRVGNGSDGRWTPGAFVRPRERRREPERLARLHKALDHGRRAERRLRLLRGELREKLTECATVGVHRHASPMRVVLDMYLPWLADRSLGQPSLGDRHQRRRRQLHDGGGEERKAADE